MMKFTEEFESASLSKKRVQKYGSEIMKLEKDYGRELKARDIVEEAKKKLSPLHDYFDWDIKDAAYKHWLTQARELLIVVKVRVINTETGRTVPLRTMVSIHKKTKGKKIRVYVRHDAALNAPAVRAQLIEQELGYLENWCSRNRERLEELLPLANGIMKAIVKVRLSFKAKPA